MSAAWLIARSEWRVRWRALVAIGLIGWLSASVAMAAVAAGRRASTSFDRMLVASGTPNAEGFYDGPVEPEKFEALTRVEGVKGAATISMLVVGPAEGDLLAGGNVIGFAIRQAFGESLSAVVVEGRRPDDDAVAEVAVNEAFRDATGFGAGDRIELVSYTDDAARQAEETGEPPEVPDGPSVPVAITGVTRHAEDVSDVADPVIIVTEAFAERYGDEIADLSSILLLRVDPDRVDAVRAATETIFPGGIGLERAEDLGARVRNGLAVQRIALYVLGAVAAAAGSLALMQNLRRFLAMSADQRRTLVSLGGSTRLDAQAVALTLFPASVGVALTSAATATAISPLMISGLARQAEPDTGVWFDWLTLAAGTALVLVAFGVEAITSAVTVGRSRPVARVTLADRLAKRLRLRAAAAIGVRFALDTGRAAGGVPTRSAIAGAAVGVAGVLGTLTFSASVDALFDRPEDWGATFDLMVENVPEERAAAMRFTREVAAVEGVGAAALNEYADTDAAGSVLRAGERSVAQQFEILQPVAGTIPLRIVDGRAPTSRDDIVVGPRILDELDIGIGETVTAEWGANRAERKVVGTVLAPGIDDVDRSAYMTPEGLEELSDDIRGALVLVEAGGVRADEVAARLADRGMEVRRLQAPSSIDNLDELGSVPSLLVGFLSVLSVVAGGSAMVLTVRRRRRELAVLRSLGFVRPQVRGAVAAQGATLGVAALLLGIPCGLVAGRLVYDLVASNVGFLVHHAVPRSAVAVVAVAALGAALAVGAAIAPSAHRLSPAATLRME